MCIGVLWMELPEIAGHPDFGSTLVRRIYTVADKP